MPPEVGADTVSSSSGGRGSRRRQAVAAAAPPWRRTRRPLCNLGGAVFTPGNALLRTGSPNPAPHSPQSALRVARQQRHPLLLPSVATIAQPGAHLDSRTPLRPPAPWLDQSAESNKSPSGAVMHSATDGSKNTAPARCREAMLEGAAAAASEDLQYNAAALWRLHGRLHQWHLMPSPLLVERQPLKHNSLHGGLWRLDVTNSRQATAVAGWATSQANTHRRRGSAKGVLQATKLPGNKQLGREGKRPRRARGVLGIDALQGDGEWVGWVITGHESKMAKTGQLLRRASRGEQ
jgi:hypothetical protein